MTGTYIKRTSSFGMPARVLNETRLPKPETSSRGTTTLCAPTTLLSRDTALHRMLGRQKKSSPISAQATGHESREVLGIDLNRHLIFGAHWPNGRASGCSRKSPSTRLLMTGEGHLQRLEMLGLVRRIYLPNTPHQ